MKRFFLTLFLAMTAPLTAQTNIVLGGEFAWGENIGWTNFRGDVENGVVVTANYLSGFAWNENVGWINFGDVPTNGTAYSQGLGDTGVNIGQDGTLNGYAWGENIGWINFEQVTYDPATGEFAGFAWGENVGWINMDTMHGVRAEPAAPAESFQGWMFF